MNELYTALTRARKFSQIHIEYSPHFFEKAREQTDKDHPVQIYLLQAELAAYRDYQVALFRLNNGAVVPADNPARVRANAELKELQRLLNAQKVKQAEELINYWVELCALDR